MNKIIMSGYLYENPQNKVTSGGISVTNFRLSVRKRHGKQGGRKTDNFNCTAFGKTADYVYKYCNSQSRISVFGEIEIDDYTDKQGQKRYSPRVYVGEVEIISTPVNEGDRMPQTGADDGVNDFTPVEDDELPFL